MIEMKTFGKIEYYSVKTRSLLEYHVQYVLMGWKKHQFLL